MSQNIDFPHFPLCGSFAHVVFAVEVGVLPIEDPPVGGSEPYKGLGCGFHFRSSL